jgi:membrane protein
MPVSVVGRVDQYQRRHSRLGFPLAVIYKYFDDRGPYLAALITYYAFVSLFPLLLLLYSVLGFVLQGHRHLRADVEHSVLQNFPVIGKQLSDSIHGFNGSGIALAVGIVGTLYGGLGAMQAAQAGFNQVYGVPRNKQPNPLRSRVRSLGLLALLGSGVVLATGIAVILSTANGISRNLGEAVHIAGFGVSFAVNVALFSTSFRLLTARELGFRQVLAGGIVAAALWMLIQALGSAYISHAFKHSQHLYGIFGIVLATLAWLYLQSVVLILSAEINVVLEYRLWPRSLLTPFTDNVKLTGADRRAYRQYAEVQRFKGFETITTEFETTGPAPSSDSGAAGAAGGPEDAGTAAGAAGGPEDAGSGGGAPATGDAPTDPEDAPSSTPR